MRHLQEIQQPWKQTPSRGISILDQLENENKQWNQSKKTQLGCNGLSRSQEHRATHLNGIIRGKVVEVLGRTRSTEEITRRAAGKVGN